MQHFILEFKTLWFTFSYSFLELLINVHEIKIATKLFHTRRNFPFYISCILYLDINIPSNILHLSIRSTISQLPGQHKTWLIWQQMKIFCHHLQILKSLNLIAVTVKIKNSSYFYIQILKILWLCRSISS